MRRLDDESLVLLFFKRVEQIRIEPLDTPRHVGVRAIPCAHLRA